jgi:hypothetical protein
LIVEAHGWARKRHVGNDAQGSLIIYIGGGRRVETNAQQCAYEKDESEEEKFVTSTQGKPQLLAT